MKKTTKYIRDSKRLDSLNSSIVLESSKTRTIRNLLKDVDTFAPEFHLSDFVIDDTKHILTIIWPSYRMHFNRLKSESILLAAMLLACKTNNFVLEDDLYEFLIDNFKEEDVQKIHIGLYKAYQRMGELFEIEV